MQSDEIYFLALCPKIGNVNFFSNFFMKVHISIQNSGMLWNNIILFFVPNICEIYYCYHFTWTEEPKFTFQYVFFVYTRLSILFCGRHFLGIEMEKIFIFTFTFIFLTFLTANEMTISKVKFTYYYYNNILTFNNKKMP